MPWSWSEEWEKDVLFLLFGVIITIIFQKLKEQSNKPNNNKMPRLRSGTDHLNLDTSEGGEEANVNLAVSQMSPTQLLQHGILAQQPGPTPETPTQGLQYFEPCVSSQEGREYIAVMEVSKQTEAREKLDSQGRHSFFNNKDAIEEVHNNNNDNDDDDDDDNSSDDSNDNMFRIREPDEMRLRMTGLAHNLDQNFNQVAGAGIDAAAFARSGKHRLSLNRQGISIVPPSSINENGSETTTISSLPSVTTAQVQWTAEKYFELHGFDLKVFSCMAVGVIDPDDEEGGFISFERPPYTLSPDKLKLKATNKQRADEVIRRAHLHNSADKLPKPKQWSKQKITEWLIEHPNISTDLAWIVSKSKEIKAEVQGAIEEHAALGNNNIRRVWNIENECRLIHVIIDDRVKPLYLDRDSVMNRAELDASRGSQRNLAWYEVAADLMNDPSFNPCSRVDPNMHCTFAEPLDLSYKVDVTPDQVKDKMSDSRVKLIKVMDRWELSGNGDGNRVDTTEEWIPRLANDEDFGRFDAPLYKSDNRRSFLLGYSEVILYLWQMFDEHDLRQSVLSRLDTDQAASVESVPMTLTDNASSSTTKKRKNWEELAASIDRIGNAETARAQSQAQVDLTRARTEATQAKTAAMSEHSRLYVEKMERLVAMVGKQNDLIFKYGMEVANYEGQVGEENRVKMLKHLVQECSCLKDKLDKQLNDHIEQGNN